MPRNFDRHQRHHRWFSIQISPCCQPKAAKEVVMLVKEIMTRKLESILPAVSLREAARKMRDLKLGSLTIAEDGKLIGMITDRDICCRGVADGFDPASTTVRET